MKPAGMQTGSCLLWNTQLRIYCIVYCGSSNSKFTAMFNIEQTTLNGLHYFIVLLTFQVYVTQWSLQGNTWPTHLANFSRIFLNITIKKTISNYAKITSVNFSYPNKICKLSLLLFRKLILVVCVNFVKNVSYFLQMVKVVVVKKI